MSKVKRLPKRGQVRPEDTWDLSSLYTSDEAWEADLARVESQIAGYEAFRGKLSSDAKTLAACLKFDSDLDRLGERVGTYAHLKTAEDQTDSRYQRMLGRFQNVATRAAQVGSFIRPEIMAVPAAKMKKMLAADEMKPYRLLVERILRYKPYTLGEKEEELLAMQGEMAGAAGRIFRQLLDADLKFGAIEDDKGRSVELSSANFIQFLESPSRSVRKAAFHQYYKQFSAHENTLAAALQGSIQKDVYYARARGYSSALQAALFPDNAPQSVYDNLIAAVRKNLLLRPPQAQDAAEDDSPLRHLRADPRRSAAQTHLETGGGPGGRVTGAAGRRVLRRARARAPWAAGATVIPIRANRAAPSARAAMTAIRSS
jgi:oligoendopeptidase F